jgi:myo-inositol 2-dehydrogenase / D-chiro-inositol 1-dehydrogenase
MGGLGMKAALHIGVVGVGRIGSLHAASLQALEGVERLTLTDADAGRARTTADELGASVAGTPEELVEAGVDALVIATPTPAHAALLRLAADAGLPAFCEKPVALEVPALDDVVAYTDRAGILVQIGFQRRFDAGFRAAREAVATGAIGNVLALRAATHDPSPPAEAYIAESGGIYRDLHIHDFDAIRFVTGDEIVEIYAAGAVRETPWFERHDDFDTAAAVLRLSGGALAVLTGTRHDPLGYDVRLEVFGTSDSIVAGSDARTPLRSVEPGSPPAPAGYPSFMERFERAYRTELAVFVETVLRGGESACSLHEARAALLVATAADLSRHQHRPVPIEEVASAQALTG